MAYIAFLNDAVPYLAKEKLHNIIINHNKIWNFLVRFLYIQPDNILFVIFHAYFRVIISMNKIHYCLSSSPFSAQSVHIYTSYKQRWTCVHTHTRTQWKPSSAVRALDVQSVVCLCVCMYVFVFLLGPGGRSLVYLSMYLANAPAA